MLKNIDQYIQETQWFSRKVSTERFTNRYINLSKVKDREDLKAAKEKWLNIYKGPRVKLTANCLRLKANYQKLWKPESREKTFIPTWDGYNKKESVGKDVDKLKILNSCRHFGKQIGSSSNN